MNRIKETLGFSIISILLLMLITFLNACGNIPFALPSENGHSSSSSGQATATVTPTRPYVFVTIDIMTTNATNIPFDGTVAQKTPLSPTEITVTPTALITAVITADATVIAQPATETPTPLISKNITPKPTIPIVYPTTSWQPPEPLSKEAMADWLVYTDKEAGYSFKYPPDAAFSSGSRPDNKFKDVYGYFQAPDSYQANMVIIIQDNKDNLPLKQYIANLTGQSNVLSANLDTMIEVKINQLSGIWDKANPLSEVLIAISSKDRVFVFFADDAPDLGGNRQLSNANKDLFYQILNTFTLLP